MGDVNFSVADGVTHNWSAEYARRLVDEMADKHNSDISDLHNELDIETATRESAVGAINGSIDEITDQLSSLSSKHDTDIAKMKNTFASTEHAGLIKLGKDGTGENKSGLIVDSSDGTCNIYCDEAYGTARTGGRVATAPATISDIDGRAQTHKPITPSTLEYAVNSVVGTKITQLQNNFNSLSSSNSQLSRRLSEVELSKMPIYTDLPVDHAEDLLVEETGIYIDGAGKTHDCGVIGPGILLVFADDNDVDVYRFYLSQGNGIYVRNGNEWIFLNEKIKYISKPVKIGEWFDGVKSVYRYVFGYSLSSNDQSVVTDASPYTILHEVTNDQNDVFVIDCKAFLRMGGDTIYEGCCIDDVPVPYIKYGFDTSGLSADYATRFDSFSGYIDFVTAANNLK